MESETTRKKLKNTNLRSNEIIGLKSWLIAIAINSTVLLIVLQITSLTYESNDDFFISKMIVDGYPYIGFINYYLCRALIAIQMKFTGINIFIVFLVVISFVSFAYLTKLVVNIRLNIPIYVLLTAVLIVFSFDHYCAVQFTKTSALVMTVGFIALVDSVIRHKSVGGYVAAFAFIYLGVAIRNRTLPAALGSTVIAIVIWMITEIRRAGEEGWIKPKKLISTAIIIVLVIGAFGIVKLSYAKCTGTPELRTAEDYSVHRSNILDYPTFKYYEQNKDKYDAIGVSENDMFLIDNWRLDYEGAATLENLRAIDSFERPPEDFAQKIIKSVKQALKLSYNSVIDETTIGMHIVLMVLLAFAMIVTLRHKNWPFVFAMGGVTLGLYAYLYFEQRAIYRAIYIVDINTVLWLIYYYAYALREKTRGIRAGIISVMTVLILVVAIICIKPLSENCSDKYERTLKHIMTTETQVYFADNKDTAFVWGTGELLRTKNYAKPWLAPDSVDDNIFGTGGWETMSPYIINKLAEYNMYNPIKDLIDNDHALYVGNKCIKELEKYLTDWYAEDGQIVKMIEVDRIDGLKVWKVVRMDA